MPAKYIQRHRKLKIGFADKIVSLQNSFNECQEEVWRPISI